MAKKQAEQSFEVALKRLEGVVGVPGTWDLALEESLAAFEEGVRLVKFCQQKLDEVEKRVELLLKDDAGKFFTRPFADEEGKETEKIHHRNTEDHRDSQRKGFFILALEAPK